MMSLSAIQENSREAAARAYEDEVKPMGISEAEWRIDLQDAREGHVPSTLRTIPNLGDIDTVLDQYPGLELVETLFIDKGVLTDLWDAGGPALSIGELAEKGLELTEAEGASLYWMLGREGQFQMDAYALRKLPEGEVNDWTRSKNMVTGIGELLGQKPGWGIPDPFKPEPEEEPEPSE